MIHREHEGWRVAIVEPGGREVSSRACADEAEACTYASVVRQHLEWLSETTFRRYYGLVEEGVWGTEAASRSASGSSRPKEA